MEQRISIITLGVSDLKKARAFYDALGWQVASEEEAENIVAYDLQSMALTLYPWEKMAEEVGIPMQRSGYSACTIAYNVRSEEEVDDTLQQAEKAGGKITKSADKAFWGGYSGYFTDVDGHVWEVAYNPFSTLGPKGEFQWNGAA